MGLKVMGSIPSQGAYPGFGFDVYLEDLGEGSQVIVLSHINVFLSLSAPSLPLSLKAI